MMDDFYNVRRLALILAVQAEIEGMKAENNLREIRGESPAFGYEQFNSKRRELENLAYAHNEQI